MLSLLPMCTALRVFDFCEFPSKYLLGLHLVSTWSPLGPFVVFKNVNVIVI